MRCPICGGGERSHLVFVDPSTGKTHTGEHCPTCGIVATKPTVKRPKMQAHNWAVLGALVLAVLMVADRLIHP